jgi:hypothetical protein
MKLFFVAMLLFTGCSSTLEPPVKPVCDDHFLIQPDLLVEVVPDATQSFMNQLLSGTGDIVLEGGVYLTAPLDIAPFIAPTTHTISIAGTGNFTGKAIIMGHLILSKLRDFETIFTDITIFKGALDIEYTQMSTWTRVRVQESWVKVRYSNRLSIVDSYWWKVNAQFDQALQFAWERGGIESSQMEIGGYKGPNSYPGNIVFNNPHLEYSELRIRDARGVRLRDGSWFLSPVHVSNSTDVKADGGEWILSDLYIDNVPQNLGCQL